MRILVTGGAGFIGSHTVDALLSKGHEVRVYDNLDPQVHGARTSGFKLPDYFDTRAEFVYGDVRDRQAFKAALEGVEGIFHLAAAVGVSQSMYEIQKYVEANTLGAAVLLDLLVNHNHQVQKSCSGLIYVHLRRRSIPLRAAWRRISVVAFGRSIKGQGLGDEMPILFRDC